MTSLSNPQRNYLISNLVDKQTRMVKDNDRLKALIQKQLIDSYHRKSDKILLIMVETQCPELLNTIGEINE